MSIFGHKRKVSLREIFFISYAGMIRGAIAFGLVLRLTDYNIDEDSAKIITTTALTLVVFTTIVFGSLMPLVQRCLVPGVEKPEDFEEIMNRDPAFSVQHEEFLHPNLDKEEEEYNRTATVAFSENITQKKKKPKIREPKCKDYLNIFDTLIMKSIFIYKYEPNLVSKKADFFDLFMKDAKKWQKDYIRSADERDERGSRIESRKVSVYQSIRNSVFQRNQSLNLHQFAGPNNSHFSNKNTINAYQQRFLSVEGITPYQKPSLQVKDKGPLNPASETVNISI